MGKIDKVSLKNFKSFRKAGIPLSAGFTAVVGPNGSGKSNIIDALCFAIGTSSMRNLRAEKLTDLVNHHSPDGTAEVEVSFTDGPEKYEFSRTIDKSGQSVFRLNGRRTTKFQIEELLRKMNVHSDGTNIIMQGDVNRFIKMTPLQRRTMIDEVSGIAEYEDKKQEAMRELNKVEEKVKEASIVLGQKEGYMKTLEREKLEAEVFMKLREEMKQLQATLVRKDLDTIEKTFTRLTEQLAQAQSEINEHRKKQQDAYAEMNLVQTQIDEMNKKIMDEMEKSQSGYRQQVEETKAQLTLIDERIKQINETIAENQKKIEETNSKITEIEKQIKEREKEEGTLGTQEDALLKAIHEKQRELEAFMKQNGLNKDLESALKKAEEMNAKIEALKENVHKVDSDCATITERMTIKKASLENMGKEMQVFFSRQTEFKERLETLRKNKGSLDRELTSYEQESSKIFQWEKEDNVRLEKIEKELSSARQKHSALSGKISAVKSIAGMNEATEAVMRAAKEKSLRGILGTVGELCKYSDEYSVAVETAAGSRMFFIVTETAADATEAVKFIKQNQLGRASFIPLDRIKPTKIDKEAEKFAKSRGAVDFAINLIDFSPKYLPVFEFVMGDTLIVDNIDAIKDIGVGSVRMVSRDGDLAEFSGLITGGFSRKTVTQNDMKLLGEYADKVTSFESEKAGVMSHIEELRSKVSQTRDNRSRTELSIREAEVMIKEIEERMKESEGGEDSTLKELQKEIAGLENALNEKQAARSALDGDVSKLITERTKMKDELNLENAEQASSELNSLQSQVQQLKDQLGELKVKRSTSKSEIDNILFKNRRDLEVSIIDINRGNGDLRNKIKAHEEEKVKAQRLLREREEKAKLAATSLTGLYKEKESLEEKRQDMGRTAGSESREIDRVKEESRDKEIEKAKIEASYAELKHSWEKYKEVELLDLTRKDVEEKIVVTQKHLDNLGNVNMKALETFEEIHKEVGDMVEKKDKLVQERESIFLMVTTIEERKVGVFMEAYNALNENFQKYFRELYPEEGAEAKLSLEDPEKPLEGGLVLYARPAGKEVKLIDSLSGGEKTLTALAFLFSVQVYKPSPFYILDEVDAALDDENSNRIAEMIKNKSNELQFIVVTHNPIVSRRADQIIGVHMTKESGSSALQIDLRTTTLDDVLKK